MPEQTTTTFTSESEFDEPITDPIEAFALLALMQAEVDTVPSYVETQGITNWIENGMEAQK